MPADLADKADAVRQDSPGMDKEEPAAKADTLCACLMQEARSILTAVWNWDYRHWEHIENQVAGPIAAMLKANRTDEETEPGKKLLELRIESCSLEEDGTAKVAVCYTWQENEPGTSQDDVQSVGHDRIIWVFVQEDGCWKAATLMH